MFLSVSRTWFSDRIHLQNFFWTISFNHCSLIKSLPLYKCITSLVSIIIYVFNRCLLKICKKHQKIYLFVCFNTLLKLLITQFLYIFYYTYYHVAEKLFLNLLLIEKPRINRGISFCFDRAAIFRYRVRG